MIWTKWTKVLKEDKISVDAFNAGRAIGKEMCHRGREKVAELLKDIEQIHMVWRDKVESEDAPVKKMNLNPSGMTLPETRIQAGEQETSLAGIPGHHRVHGSSFRRSGAEQES